MNRDGSPTTLTRELYKNLLGAGATAAQRRRLYAQYLAAETEFWRCHRTVAGVLHFTALGYSRNSGQTSDHFVKVTTLQYEPEFLKYVPDAFSPIGLMLDEWGEALAAGQSHLFPVIAINDLEKDWRGEVELRVLKEGNVVSKNSERILIPAYGTTRLGISCALPKTKAIYTVEAVLKMANGREVKSIRELPVE